MINVTRCLVSRDDQDTVPKSVLTSTMLESIVTKVSRIIVPYVLSAAITFHAVITLPKCVTSEHNSALKSQREAQRRVGMYSRMSGGLPGRNAHRCYEMIKYALRGENGFFVLRNMLGKPCSYRRALVAPVISTSHAATS